MAINTLQGSGTVITEYDQWRVYASSSVDAGDIIKASWERADYQSGYIGSGMSIDSSTGYWTFPRTGRYHVHTQWSAYKNANLAYCSMVVDVTTNGGSNWQNISAAWNGSNYNIANPHFCGSTMVVVHCDNTSNIKLRFRMDQSTSGITLFGGTYANHTAAAFIRVGD
mgnify:CR=1 FL=1|tara:strand:- start:1059 stop:1562 length:504 start_codon:yes stop_codon:yes gene_type:complete